MYKNGFGFNNLQWLIYRKTKKKQKTNKKTKKQKTNKKQTKPTRGRISC